MTVLESEDWGSEHSVVPPPGDSVIVDKMGLKMLPSEPGEVAHACDPSPLGG